MELSLQVYLMRHGLRMGLSRAGLDCICIVFRLIDFSIWRHGLPYFGGRFVEHMSETVRVTIYWGVVVHRASRRGKFASKSVDVGEDDWGLRF